MHTPSHTDDSPNPRCPRCDGCLTREENIVEDRMDHLIQIRCLNCGRRVE